MFQVLALLISQLPETRHCEKLNLRNYKLFAVLLNSCQGTVFIEDKLAWLNQRTIGTGVRGQNLNDHVCKPHKVR